MSGSSGKKSFCCGCRGHMSFEYGRPKYSSKPCCSGQELRVMAEVPLAVDGRGVAALLEHLGDRHFVRIDAVRRRVVQRPLDADAIRVAPVSSAARDAEQTAWAT